MKPWYKNKQIGKMKDPGTTFDQVASLYKKARPDFPDDLFEDIIQKMGKFWRWLWNRS